MSNLSYQQKLNELYSRPLKQKTVRIKGVYNSGSSTSQKKDVNRVGKWSIQAIDLIRDSKGKETLNSYRAKTIWDKTKTGEWDITAVHFFKFGWFVLGDDHYIRETDA